MRYENLPIYKSAMDLAVYIEQIVKSFDKYYKYTIGEDLRNYSKELLFLIHRANSRVEKSEHLLLLRDKCEESRILKTFG